MAISIWRVAAERWLRGDDSPFAAEVFDAARHLRRIAAGDRTGTEGAAADQPGRYQE
jgi:hypothetical protein